MTSPSLAATGQWESAGVLPSPASWYGQSEGAVRLGNGKVLVAGGADGTSAALAKAALFDPAADPPAWTATAAMQVARRQHAMTLLDDGRVLVTGGTSGATPLSPGLPSAEIFNPANGSWAGAAPMLEPRRGHTAVLLPNKKVLVAGGTAVRSSDSVKSLATAELYDPETNTWAATGSMGDARGGHTAVVLTGGRVLVAGGSAPISGTGEAALAFCELYTQSTGKWTPTGSLLQPRSRHQAVGLSGTTVLVVGGSTPGTPGDGTFDPFNELTAELFDVGSGLWTEMPSRPGGRGFHRAVALGAGKVLVVGGTADTVNDAGYASVLLFDSQAKTWSVEAGLTVGRWGFAATALEDGKVLVAGGVTRSGLAAAAPGTDDVTATTELFSTGSGA
jgi:Kelch motif protein/galactose oxidase-like protein